MRDVVIGIGGAGGLGSNCAVHLIRSGFKKFVIYDFDRVEASNLNRQFYFKNQIGRFKAEALSENLKLIEPDADIQKDIIRVERCNIDMLFENCDVVIEAFDNVVSKRLMFDTFINSAKLFVGASGMGGYGNLDKLRTKRLGKNGYLVGDFETEICSDTPSYSTRVGIVAAMEADAVITYYKELENDK